MIFTPAPDADNGPALRSLLASGERHIQINGPCRIDTKIVMADANGPYHGLVIEPVPGLEKVVIDVTGIGVDPVDPTNPSYAGFEYDGGFEAASYLVKAGFAGEHGLFVDDPSQYEAGDWVYISDNSTDPNFLYPKDGPCEVRRVLYKTGTGLVLERALLRKHPNGAIVARCNPIHDLRIRGLEFTGHAAIGFHAHCAQRCIFDHITAASWTGRCMLLIDAGGSDNLIINSYCIGTTAGIDPGESVWGVALEGQERSRVIRSGGENCGVGLAINFSTDTESYEAKARLCTVNAGLYTASLRSRLVRSDLSQPLALNSVVTADCVDCEVLA